MFSALQFMTLKNRQINGIFRFPFSIYLQCKTNTLAARPWVKIKPFDGHYQSAKAWNTMSDDEKCEFALDAYPAPSADVAFYRGIALAGKGEEFFGDAVSAFMEATIMDETFSMRVNETIRELQSKRVSL